MISIQYGGIETFCPLGHILAWEPKIYKDFELYQSLYIMLYTKLI